jgi:outer membrane receptor protein involved in Fe transport
MKANHKVAYAITTILSGYAGASFAATDSAAISDSAELQEIVVTAEHKSESIQDVPITIQAIGGEELTQLNVTTFDDALKLLPNVTFSENGPGQGNIYMRGLSVGFAGSQSSATIDPFPNVATFLDEASLTFPGHNLDVYMVDMERIEVLEGPQGTLFGGSAEAGAIRYITNKPKLDVTEGYAEGSYGTTAHGDPNSSASVVLNLPLIPDTLAVRGVIYDDRRGGYIDNVQSDFTRNPTLDHGPAAYGVPYPAHLDTYNNNALVERAQNPTTYQGVRLSALAKFNEDWNLLVQQSYQYLDAEGMPVSMPVGLNFQTLGPLEETSFSPAYNRDRSSITSWTVNGKLGDIKLLYTGSYLVRRAEIQQDYTNYTRTAGGMYYTCAGGAFDGIKGPGANTPLVCYSPVDYWNDYFINTHQSHELRLSTPDDWRLRGLAGVYWENFDIKDDMNFNQNTIPDCTAANLAAALSGGPVCVSTTVPVNAAIDPSPRGANDNFGEDDERGHKQLAFFTSVDFDLIPKVLTLTGGTRWFRYSEFMEGSQWGDGGCYNIPNASCFATPIDYSTHNAVYSGFKSRGNLSWHVTPDTMVYYTFSQGYRPGAFNRTEAGEVKIWVDAAGNPLPNGVASTAADSKVKQFNKPLSYGPDSLTNNEIGLKSEFLDHRLLVNASAYSMNWQNVQTLIYNPPIYGNTTFGLTGPTYRVRGGELQLAIKPIEPLTLTGNFSYNDATQTTSPCITSSGVTPTTKGNPTPAGQCLAQVASGAVNVAVANPLGAIGSTPAFSPKLQYNLRAKYDFHLGDYKTFAQVGMSHIDSMDNQPSSFQSGNGIAVPTTTWLRYTMPGYETYDASFGLAKDQWNVLIFGQNLTNTHPSTFTTSGQDIVAEVPLRPRVLGVKVGMKF